MDYSVCLGIHDCERSELDEKEKEKLEHSDGEGSGENGPEDDEEEDSAGSGGAGLTPPDSPQAYREELPLNANGLNPSRDIYATASSESELL